MLNMCNSFIVIIYNRIGRVQFITSYAVYLILCFESNVMYISCCHLALNVSTIFDWGSAAGKSSSAVDHQVAQHMK